MCIPNSFWTNPCHLAHHALRLFCCQRFLLPGLLTPKGLHIEGQARQMQVPPHPHKNQMQVRLGVVCNHPLRDSDHSPPKALVVLTCSEYLSVILCDRRYAKGSLWGHSAAAIHMLSGVAHQLQRVHFQTLLPVRQFSYSRIFQESNKWIYIWWAEILKVYLKRMEKA